MIHNIVENEYFNWLYKKACGNRYPEQISYKKLLMYLHSKIFRYHILKDRNRAEDGISLRRRFTYDCDTIEDADLYLTEPCSVLEMMLALAIRCEESIMDDFERRDRTTQWFWCMVTNLGIGSMTDDRFDKKLVNDAIERFLDGDYAPDGKGGLFYIRNCDTDLRYVEIWTQLLWYLDSIT